MTESTDTILEGDHLRTIWNRFGSMHSTVVFRKISKVCQPTRINGGHIGGWVRLDMDSNIRDAALMHTRLRG